MGRLRAWFKKHYHRMAGKRRLAFGVFIDRERFEVVLFGWAHIWYWSGPIERAKIRTVGDKPIHRWTFSEVQGPMVVNQKVIDRINASMLNDLVPAPKVSMSSRIEPLLTGQIDVDGITMESCHPSVATHVFFPPTDLRKIRFRGENYVQYDDLSNSFLKDIHDKQWMRQRRYDDVQPVTVSTADGKPLEFSSPPPVVLKSPAEVLWSRPLDHYRFVTDGQVLTTRVRSEMVSLADRSEQVYCRVEDDHPAATHILYDGKFHEIDWIATNADNTIFDRLSVAGGTFFRRSELLPGSWYVKIKDRYGARERTEATGTNQG